MNIAGPLARLDSLDGYRQFFIDVGLWRPFVQRVCRLHELTCNQVRPGTAGTFPVFIVDDLWVVKFYGPLFDGKTCWQVEQEADRLMQGLPAIPVARLVASGLLEREPGWTYLIFEYLPGVSIAEVYSRVPDEDKLSFARWLGESLPPMHRLKVSNGTAFPRLNEELVKGWFSTRWPGDRAAWPAHLAAQVEPYLLANAPCLQADSNCFIHADLTQDHFLGNFSAGHFSLLGVIDFGDAMLGNIYYELAALHLDLFDCDKRLLAEFLQAYGLPPDRDFVRKGMTTSLLHQFDVYGPLFSWKPELRAAQTLDELANRLWKVDDLIF
jgi:hygromycin-B 7''-O-kinase